MGIWSEKWIKSLGFFNKEPSDGEIVLSIHIEEGKIFSEIQSLDQETYSLIIDFKMFEISHWNKIVDLISSKDILVSAFLSGEVPVNIEEIFDELNISLIPTSHDILMTNCSCDDWSNPCKHVNYIYYLIGKEFDKDPFMLFKLRGIDKESFILFLEQKLENKIKEEELFISSISANPKKFWKYEKKIKTEVLKDVIKPSCNAFLIKGIIEDKINKSICDVYHDTSIAMLNFIKL